MIFLSCVKKLKITESIKVACCENFAMDLATLIQTTWLRIRALRYENNLAELFPD